MPLLLGAAYLQPLSLALLLAMVAGVYTVVLRASGELMGQRKEKMIESLRVTD